MSVAADVSLEDLVDGIVSPRSKEYFREVYSSFNNGNYRAAIVGLWSVAVFDLHAKLRHLRDIFADKVASDVLDELAQLNAANPKSSEWETRLIEVAEARVGWIDVATRDLLKNLQQQRHLAAHPVITAAGELVTPSRDEVRAKLRLVLEKLLTVPATATSSLDERVLEDLAGHSSLLQVREDVARFLESRFLRHMSSTHVERLFRSFWKLVLRVENDQCNANREINFNALLVLGRRLGRRASELVRAEQSFYSNVATSPKLLNRLVFACSELPGVFDALGTDAQTLVRAHLATDFGLWCAAVFVSPSVDAHLSQARSKFQVTPTLEVLAGIENLIQRAVEAGFADAAYGFGAHLYGQSPSYNDGNERFEKLVRPFLERWSEATFDAFVEETRANDQTWGRHRSREDHRLVARTYETRFGKKLSVPSSANRVFATDDVVVRDQPTSREQT
jgi:hypothetical protein